MRNGIHFGPCIHRRRENTKALSLSRPSEIQNRGPPTRIPFSSKRWTWNGHGLHYCQNQNVTMRLRSLFGKRGHRKFVSSPFSGGGSATNVECESSVYARRHAQSTC